MKKIKRLKIQESFNKWNLKNSKLKKKTAYNVGPSIGVNGRSISLWNTGSVPKQIQCLHDISTELKFNFDDFFEFEYDKEKDVVVLTRIRIKEAITEWNKTGRKQSFGSLAKNIGYAEKRLKLWNNGQLPFAITNFFNFCKELEIKKPSKLLEF